MSDTVLLYPTSSCQECKLQYPATKGYRSNMATNGCRLSPYFNCYDKLELSQTIQPKEEMPDIYALNPQVYTSKTSPDFNPVGCQTSCGCPQPSFISRDPRLFDSARADYLPLDTPPMNGDVRLKNIYNQEYEGYGQGYRQYKDIRDGQIMYYVDRSIEDAFYKPVWSEPSINKANLYVDPMGARKPEYNRVPILNTSNPTTDGCRQYPYCLSFLQDTQSQREDIMAWQQRKNNQQKWTARWTTEN